MPEPTSDLRHTQKSCKTKSTGASFASRQQWSRIRTNCWSSSQKSIGYWKQKNADWPPLANQNRRNKVCPRRVVNPGARQSRVLLLGGGFDFSRCGRMEKALGGARFRGRLGRSLHRQELLLQHFVDSLREFEEAPVSISCAACSQRAVNSSFRFVNI